MLEIDLNHFFKSIQTITYFVREHPSCFCSGQRPRLNLSAVQKVNNGTAGAAAVSNLEIPAQSLGTLRERETCDPGHECFGKRRMLCFVHNNVYLLMDLIAPQI